MKNQLSQPRGTFFNLAAEKQALVEAVLVKEFATKGYQKASLNSIVKALGIAKGSLYQYFANKESMFLFVFDQFTRLVKGAVVKPEAVEIESCRDSFWGAVRRVMQAGIEFISRHPLYFQLYLQVLHEDDIPYREELIRRVRLFSSEFFGPMIEAGQRRGEFVGVSVSTIIFIVDAVMDRFFQGYAHGYLDGGLDLSGKTRTEINDKIDQIILTLDVGISQRY